MCARHLQVLASWHAPRGDEAERVEGDEDNEEGDDPESDLKQRVVGDGGVRSNEAGEDEETAADSRSDV